MNTARIAVAGLGTLLFVALAPATATAGPWSRDSGSFYAKVGQTAFYSGSFVDISGTVVEGVSNLSFITSAYGEVGIYRGLQVAASVPLTYSCNDFGSGGGEFCNTSAGDLLVALQYQLPKQLLKPLVLAVRTDLKIPLYSNNNSDPFEHPRPGDAQIDVTFWLSAGASFGSLPLYAFAEVGYRVRTEAFIGDTPPDREFFDGVVLSTQVGYKLFNRLTLGVSFGGV
ncbi:MAG: hypothetical protein KC503_44140, partial [Myxococcales bacterium]|nr:hypothetical protein [Myxococcales bacterium]